MVKQQPIEADASVVPMETETNVKDDDELKRSSMEIGPSILRECDDCKNRRSDIERQNLTRLVIIDCRIDML